MSRIHPRCSSNHRLGLAVLTGAAVTMTSLAGNANAAAGSVWDRVAACESSGNWHIKSAPPPLRAPTQGYFGGLQFWQPTWVDFGGRKYAPRADIATRHQQIEVARRVLAVQGPRAWPVCSKRAKLTKANGGATRSALPRIGPFVRTLPKPVPRPAPQPKPTPRPAPAHAKYQVQSGDTLSGIAARHGVHGGWRALWDLNRSHVPNPNVIFIGQVLRLS
jgi:hypothetical protein